MSEITNQIVEDLVKEQFPQWAHLEIRKVRTCGHDNRTYHLGTTMSIRLPSSKAYEPQIEKEVQLLKKLSPYLPLPIQKPIALGRPNASYPHVWSINAWIDGKCLAEDRVVDKCQLAKDLASFLKALQAIDTTDGPKAGAHNFYRGGLLSTYDTQTRQALNTVQDLQKRELLKSIWEEALASTWEKPDVWVHGDIAPGNLLMKQGVLCAVIDFGILGIGDPACDYAMAWTYFDQATRKLFFEVSGCDDATWKRARGWALWKALITYYDENQKVAQTAAYTLHEIIDEG